MANLPESSTWENAIYQLETTDAALGGPGAVMNSQATDLGNRTKWLYDALAVLSTSVSNLLNSFTYLRNSYKYSQGTPSVQATTAFTATLNQNVNYVYINANISIGTSTITLQAASVTNVGRRIVFNVNYSGAGALVIIKSDLTVLVTDYYYYSRVIVIEYIQTGASTYDVEVISDQELKAASNAITQAGTNARQFVTPAGLRTQSAWVNFTLLSSWIDGYDTPRYMRDNLGFVHLDGGMNGVSATDNHCFTLPVGFRPTRRIIHWLTSTDETTYTPMYINSDGTIEFSGTYNKQWNISGIIFSTQ